MRRNLRVFRVKLGLTQDDFAKRIGYSRSYCQLVESGKYLASMRFWLKISEQFSVPMSEVVELMKVDEN